MKRTTKSIQAEIAKGAFRPHTALSTMALAYYQQETTSFAKNMFPVCPVQLSSDNYYVFDKEDLSLKENKEEFVKKCMSLTMECIKAHIFVATEYEEPIQRKEMRMECSQS